MVHWNNRIIRNDLKSSYACAVVVLIQLRHVCTRKVPTTALTWRRTGSFGTVGQPEGSVTLQLKPSKPKKREIPRE